MEKKNVVWTIVGSCVALAAIGGIAYAVFACMKKSPEKTTHEPVRRDWANL